MSDNLKDGRCIRSFNVIDDYNREGLAIDVDLSMPSARVIWSLERIIDMGISSGTFYNWRSKFAGMEPFSTT